MDAAVQLVDEQGLEELTMRALAARVGLSPMALYHHLPSRQALLDAITDRLLDEVIDPADTRGTFVERLTTVARSYIALARRHPEAFPLFAMRRFDSSRGFAFVEGLLSLFRERGCSARESAYAFRVLGYYLNGAALADIGIRERRRDARPSRLARFSEPDRYPLLTEAAEDLGIAGLEPTFALGLGAMLELIETKLCVSSRTRSRSGSRAKRLSARR